MDSRLHQSVEPGGKVGVHAVCSTAAGKIKLPTACIQSLQQSAIAPVAFSDAIAVAIPSIFLDGRNIHARRQEHTRRSSLCHHCIEIHTGVACHLPWRRGGEKLSFAFRGRSLPRQDLRFDYWHYVLPRRRVA
jgi:hypothetical protein